MRDPNRIPHITDILEEAWKKYPDLRLCQLVTILCSMAGREGDIFYVEDDVIEASLHDFMKKYST